MFRPFLHPVQPRLFDPAFPHVGNAHGAGQVSSKSGHEVLIARDLPVFAACFSKLVRGHRTFGAAPVFLFECRLRFCLDRFLCI